MKVFFCAWVIANEQINIYIFRNELTNTVETAEKCIACEIYSTFKWVRQGCRSI